MDPRHPRGLACWKSLDETGQLTLRRIGWMYWTTFRAEMSSNEATIPRKEATP
jgi:hypothetical protein